MTAPGDVLRALASLATADNPDEVVWDVTGAREPVAWLGAHVEVSRLFGVPALDTRESHVPLFQAPDEISIKASTEAVRLHALDTLHRDERILRAGWLWICGTIDHEGTPTRVCTPVLTRPVRFRLHLGSYTVRPIGDAEAALGGQWAASVGEEAEFYDPALGGQPSAAMLARLPRLRRWAQRAVSSSGLPAITEFVGSGRPEPLAERAGLRALVGTGIYVERAARPGTRASALYDWAGTEHLESTAFSAVYGSTEPRDTTGRSDLADVPQPLPLTEAQAAVVQRSRHEQLVCVSGAPGNGKSHLVAAIAIDAVARGEAVLVATPTPFAADVLSDLLHRKPGPEPVAFGEGEARQEMARLLDSCAASILPDDVVEARRARVELLQNAYEAAEASVAKAIEREARGERSELLLARGPELRAAVPAPFAPGADLTELAREVNRAWRRRRSPLAAWWARRARAACGAGPDVDVDLLAEAVNAAGDARAAAQLDASGGTTIGAAWDELLRAEGELADAEGQLVDALVRAEHRWEGGGRRAVAALQRALAAGRQRRRDLLADIDAGDLLRALPLWIGTLRDVEDLLPARTAMFDLVVVDEAAQVDQFRGAGALLRAKRAVVVGDPRQLRHVSFVADDDVDAAVKAAGVGELADRLDVRRLSLFDLTAGSTRVTWLDEHFRSVPHIISFSAKRFYENRVLVATRNPGNESTDVIDAVRVAGGPDDEVSATVDVVARMVAEGRRSIAAVSPFRKQAEALEAALLARFEPEEIDAAELRVGTAHSFQGSECDHVVIALGLRAGDPGNRWRFVEDPNLFNVLVTRGRESVTVVTSLAESEQGSGIVAAYLRYGEHGPPAPKPGEPASPWVAALGAELARQGLLVRPEYPVGRWKVVLCAGEGGDAAALDCVPHPDGPLAHIARHRALRRAGWRVIDAFPSRWDGDPVVAAVELRSLLAPA